MFTTTLKAAAIVIVSTFSLQGAASAAPVKMGDLKTLKTASDVVQVRHGGGRGFHHGGHRFGHRWDRHRHFRHGGYFVVSDFNDGCGHYYRKWKRTGSGYWRNRYYDCISD